MRPPRIRRLFQFGSRTSGDLHDDVRDEVEFHLEMRTADLMADGLTPSEARIRAREEFGDVAGSSARLFKQDRELERSRTLGRVASELRQDTAYAVRLIARNRTFSFAAVLTLGVAIGGNTAIFSMVNALFF